MATKDTPEGGPRLGVIGWARWSWRTLTSMRTALLLLLLLALGSVPGSVLPQRGVDPVAVREYINDHGTVGDVLDALGFFGVYSSAWFSAIYLLLFISLVGCIIPRVGVYARALRKPPPAVPTRLTGFTGYGTRSAAGTKAAAVRAVAGVLRARRYRVVADEAAGTVRAEKGFLREAGNLVFHVSLLGLLVSFASTSLFSYSGQALVPVGSSFTNSTVNLDAFVPGRAVDATSLPAFSVKLKDFDAAFEEAPIAGQFAQPRSFTAHVETTNVAGDVESATLEVNKPIAIDGAQVFLAGNGYAPVVSVTDGAGQKVFSGAVPFLVQDEFYTSQGVVKVPDADPQELGLQSIFLPTAAQGRDGLRSVFPQPTNPELVFAVFAGNLGLDRGAQSAFRLDQRRLEQVMVDAEGGKKQPFRARLKPGDTIELPDGLGSVTFESVQRYAALTVRRDPGMRPALVFALLAVVGIMASLMLRRRRIWVEVVDTGPVVEASAGSVVAQYAGSSDGTDPHFGEHIVTVVTEALGPDPATGDVVDVAAHDPTGAPQQR